MNITDDEKKNWFAEVLNKFIPDDIDIKNKTPEQIIKEYSKKAASVGFVAALPTGFLGWATILPEIALTTKIQINMIYSLAKYFNKNVQVNSTFIAMIFAEALGIDIIKTLVTRSGGKIVVSNLIKNGLKTLLEKISMNITKKIATRLPSRWVPFILAPVYSAFAYSSTKLIGKYAMIYLTKEIVYELPEKSDDTLNNV